MDWSKVVSPQEVFKFILKHSKENGVAPSLGEIQKHFGWKSKTAAQNQVKLLARNGLIEKTKTGRIKFPSILRK